MLLIICYFQYSNLYRIFEACWKTLIKEHVICNLVTIEPAVATEDANLNLSKIDVFKGEHHMAFYFIYLSLFA